MIRAILFGVSVVSLVVLSFPARGEIPDTYLGSWQLDLVKTFSVQMEKVAEDLPEELTAEDMSAQLEAIAAASETEQAQVLFTITDETITVRQSYSGVDEQIPYRVISGNSAHVVVELMPVDDEPMISKIRLVEGGIAIQEEDCAVDPDGCLRRQRAAAEKARIRLKVKADKMRREVMQGSVPQEEFATDRVPTEGAVESHIVVQTDLDGTIASEPGSDTYVPAPPPSEPKWIYLKKVK